MEHPDPGRPVRAVLSDMDGKLLDTAPDMVGALNALRTEQGLDAVPFESARQQVSHGAGALVRLGCPHVTEREPLQLRYLELSGCRLRNRPCRSPGVAELLAALPRRGDGVGSC